MHSADHNPGVILGSFQRVSVFPLGEVVRPEEVRMRALLRRFWSDKSATAAIEYGLIAGMIACFSVAALQKIGVNVSAKFGRLSAALS